MSAGKLSKRLMPQTPVTPASCQTVYHQARQLFSRSADPGQLIGRDDERERLRAFLGRCGTAKPAGCMYVSGPPGTGKSAMVKEVTEEVLEGRGAVRQANVNCMSIKTSSDLYATLLDLLGMEAELLESGAVAALQRRFLARKTSDVYVVVLDEIDHILTLDLESLYRMFEWSMQSTSRLVLVGIANALDLTDRLLPRLKARNLKPELLPFLPYAAPQIKSIITTRLRSLVPAASPAAPDFVPFFHPAAIELCSRKVSSQTGDLRKAFEILRRAIDLVEAETRLRLELEAKEKTLLMTPSKKPLGENRNEAGPSRGTAARSPSAALLAALAKLTVENAPRVSIGHLSKVTAAAFGHGTSHRLKALNLQQKAALCALVALEKRNRTAVAAAGASPATPAKARVTAPTIKTLFDTYCRLCRRDSLLHPLSGSEFREVVGSLETLSLVTPVHGKTGSFAVLQQPNKKGRKAAFGSGDEKRVASCVGEKEVEQGMEGLGAGVLMSILSGEALG